PNAMSQRQGISDMPRGWPTTRFDIGELKCDAAFPFRLASCSEGIGTVLAPTQFPSTELQPSERMERSWEGPPSTDRMGNWAKRPINGGRRAINTGIHCLMEGGIESSPGHTVVFANFDWGHRSLRCRPRG